MATPAPQPTGGPVNDLNRLASIATPTTSSEMQHLIDSQRATMERLAAIIDVQAVQVERMLRLGDKRKLLERGKARLYARRIRNSMHLEAERVRGGAAAARKTWFLFVKLFGFLMNPPKAGDKGFNFEQ